MTLHELVRKRLRQRKEQFKRSKELAKHLLNREDYELPGDAYERGYRRIHRMTKEQIIRKFLTEEDIILFNEI